MEWRKPKEKLYVPRVMVSMMLATTANSTSTYFGLGHMCHKHNKLFTMEHVEECSEIRGCDNIKKYARKLKERNIMECYPEERL